MGIQQTVKTIVGNLACQKNAMLKSLETQVVECRLAENLPKTYDYQGNDDLWEIELEDTILFPEGGGQPSDLGTINLLDRTAVIHVLYVFRRGLDAIHLCRSPIKQGTRVRISLDWVRRKDHMQQHTGQHLLSAILEREPYKIPTLSWFLGPDISYIELLQKPTIDELEQVEARCNQVIAENMLVTVENTTETPKTLPSDYDAKKGIIRVVSIGKLDRNPCCGTHVPSTAYLNILVLLHITPIRSTNVRLHFVVGDRAIKLLKNSFYQIKMLSSFFSCRPEEIEEKIHLSNQNIKNLRKSERYWMFEAGESEANRIKNDIIHKGVSFVFKVNGNNDYFNAIIRNLGKNIQGVVVFCSGETQKSGQLIIIGDPKKVEAMSERVMKAVSNVKGGGKSRWQGKVSTWKPKEIEQLQQIVENFYI
ncbi:hypothetical protein PMAC_001311 [Pneumocystis sp. 'macacae']|nr:hypothetical protein PMAC_001311 [Pneumocystis sp. 'macacae']